MASKYPNSRAVIFNAGAAASNPVWAGPGPRRCIHYHIVGDIISTHMSEKAARVVRIKTNVAFGSADAHSSMMITNKAGAWSYSTPTEEDMLYLAWARKTKSILMVVGLLTNTKGFINLMKDAIKESPIPDSERALLK